MKTTQHERQHRVKLPPFRVKARTLLDFIEKLADESEQTKLTLTEDDGRTEITLEGLHEIRDNVFRIETPFTLKIDKIELSAGDTFGTYITYSDSDKNRAQRFISFLCDETPWHLDFPFRFFQKYFFVKMFFGLFLANIPLYWLNHFFITVALTVAWICLIAYSMMLEFYATPRIIHREGGSWYERNKDQLAVYLIIAVFSAALSNLDRLWDFIQAFTNR